MTTELRTLCRVAYTVDSVALTLLTLSLFSYPSLSRAAVLAYLCHVNLELVCVCLCFLQLFVFHPFPSLSFSALEKGEL